MVAASQPDTTTNSRLAGRSLIIGKLLWWIIAALSIGVFALAALAYHQQIMTSDAYKDGLNQLGIPLTAYAAYQLGLSIFQFAVFVIVAVALFRRRSDDWMAILVSIVLITFGGFTSNVGSVTGIATVGSLTGRLVIAMLSVANITFVTFLFIYPDGRFMPGWTRGPVTVWIAWNALEIVWPESPISYYSLPAAAQFVIPLVYYVTSLIVQGYRHYHYYTPVQKQQTKWLLAGLVISLIGGYLVFYWPTLIFPSLNGNGPTALIYQMVARLVSSVSVMAVPAAMVFSILRYRLWDVDFLINRSLVYGALTVGLVAQFVLGFFVVNLLFTRLHEGMNAGIALAVAGVAFGLLFMPARRHMQRIVDQRLYGINIDYNKTPAPTPAGDGVVTIGTRLGVYEITGKLGKGGMAEVFKGRDATQGREVAIKTLPANLATESDFRQRFEREARIVAALKHPNIVELYDSGEANGAYYMVMEYIKGGDLSDYMRDKGLLPIEETRRLIGQVGGALDYAHQQGIVHRDVKPSNVMLASPPNPLSTSGEGELRPALADFGIARIVGGTTRITRTGIMGTFDYMAPEQIRDATDVDGRADIYSLGVMLFQMLTGRLPFTASNPGALLIAHLNQPAPDPRSLRADVPEEVAEATLKALEKDPARRFQMAGEFAAALA